MTSEVGSGQIAYFATFKGMRKAISTEVDGATKSASGQFTSAFTKAGVDSGKRFGSSFATSSSASLKTATADVAKASREVSAARLKEQDAAGKVRVAETQLAEARRRYAGDSSQVVRAEERLATVQRSHTTVQSGLVSSTDRLAGAQRGLATAVAAAGTSGQRTGSVFSRMPAILGSAGSSGGQRFSQGFLDVLGGALGANIITGIGFTIGSQINQGIRSGIGYGVQGVALASDLEQSVGAVSAVFKNQADAIFDAAATASTGVGLTRAAYLKYSTIVGAQLKNLGLPINKVSKQTNDLITLGADLAAQFGGPTSDAVGALSSLLRGERDPIERYGVGLKQIDIDARKAALGLDGLTDEADKQATIQATLSLLWEQTSDAQGTFFRETDTYAHKQQVLNAQLEEAQTKLGEALLPAFSSAATFANDTLIPALDGVIDKVGPRLAEALDAAGPRFQSVAEKAAPLITGLLSAAADNGIPLFIDGMDDFAEAAPGWVSAFKAIDDAGNAFWDWFTDDSRNGRDAVRGFFAGIAPDASMTQYKDSYLELKSTSTDTRTAIEGDLDALEKKYGDSSSTMVQGMLAELRAGKDPAVVAGNNTARGFADGITSQEDLAVAAAKRMAGRTVGELRFALKINSPSKVTEELGGYTADGFIKGIVDKTSAVERATAAMVSIGGSADGVTLSPVATSRVFAQGSSGDASPVSIVGTLDLGNGLTGLIRGVISGELNRGYAASFGRG